MKDKYVTSMKDVITRNISCRRVSIGFTGLQKSEPKHKRKRVFKIKTPSCKPFIVEMENPQSGR